MQQPMCDAGAPFANVAQVSDLAHTRYIPNMSNTRFIYENVWLGRSVEVVWNKPYTCNQQYRAPIPADSVKDMQTFFFGPMTHSLTLRPRRAEEGCCACFQPMRFDVASDMFSQPFAAGQIENGCVSMLCCTHDVTVNFPNGPLQGKMSPKCCTMQPSFNLDWATGENFSFRALPICLCCVLCNSFRIGYVGTAPGEEERDEIRYWDKDGFLCYNKYLTCDFCMQVNCCPDKINYTSWDSFSLYTFQQLLQKQYSFVLESSFGKPTKEWNAEFLPGGQNAGAHPSDINALGNWRMQMHKDCCCCWKFSDASDVDLVQATGMDITFRGSFNQNHIDQRDFHLVLGYMILQTFGFLKNGGGLKGINFGVSRPLRKISGRLLPGGAGEVNPAVMNKMA